MLASIARFFTVAIVGSTLGSGAVNSARAAAGAPEPRFDLADLMPPFFAFWDATSPTDPVERVRLFREQILGREPLYALIPVTITDEHLGRYFAKLGPRLPVMRELGSSFPAAVRAAWAGFIREFPDVNEGATIVLLPSLGIFDGYSTSRNERPVLLFGLDQIAQTSGAQANFVPQIQHEIFHLYHAQISPGLREIDALYASLWQEGLAVYVSQALNPDASEREIHLSDTLVTRARPMIPALAAELRQKLDSTLPKDRQDFFFLNTTRRDIPAKSGYFIGALVAERLARNLSLMELAQLGGADLRGAIERELRNLETPPGS